MAREVESISVGYDGPVHEEDAKDMLTGKLRMAMTLTDDDDEGLYAIKIKALARFGR